MRNLFRDEGRKLRNGWWALIFIGLLLAVGAPMVFSVKALRQAGLPAGLTEPTGFLFVLAATWICVALRRESLASVGFRLDRRWAADLAWGTLLGGGVMLLAALLAWAAGGVRFALDPARSAGSLVYGLWAFLCVSLFEEALFRGFLFQRLRDGLGTTPTQVLLAAFFAVAHWNNPGMVGATKAWATVDIALAAVFLGLAYLRTGSLALPIGIHLGWNWTQGNVLGFGVSGTTGRPGWLKPVFQDRPEWVTGGAFGLEASVFGVLAVLVGIALLFARRPLSAGPSTGLAPAGPDPG
jgi:hypothetical protein